MTHHILAATSQPSTSSTEEATQLFVKSHVARDLLQSAGLFKTDKLVVWEYVSNGLQYVDANTNPTVRVTLDNRRKRLTITDNGRGMSWADLQNFFVMHGTNQDRLAGQAGRGRFGTGKSAAFGIADTLRVTTVRNNLRSQVALSRAKIEIMNSEQPIPVEVIERETPVNLPNGTHIEIENIHLRSLDQSGVIAYIERHLARWSKNAVVFVNNHECEYAEPAVAETRRFKPEGAVRDALGETELTLKVSKAPLDEATRGIGIFSKGVWHETTLAGSEGREMANYIFGEIDVPALDEDRAPITPFDVSRSMRLNPNNELVRTIHAFIGVHIEQVRRELGERERRRRNDEETRKLAAEAAEIASVINEDFNQFRQRVALARARARGGADLLLKPEPVADSDDLIFGNELPAEVIAPTGGEGVTLDIPRIGEGAEVRTLAPIVAITDNPESPKQGRPREASNKQRNAGGFDVKFGNLGAEDHRAKYVRDERTIYINLDHAQLVAAKGSRAVQDPVFRRLAYEVAFSEYAIALASELAARDEYIDPSDPIFDIRETLNRVARRGASLYAEQGKG